MLFCAVVSLLLFYVPRQTMHAICDFSFVCEALVTQPPVECNQEGLVLSKVLSDSNLNLFCQYKQIYFAQDCLVNDEHGILGLIAKCF